MKKEKLVLILHSVFGFLSVGLGAFGTHGLREKLSPKYYEVWKTANEYNFYHSISGILAVILFLYAKENKFFYGSIAFVLGNILFSGSLYFLAITEIKFLGIITPFGGVLFLIGWFFLILGSTKISLK
ncbi:MAG: DUF423 domain-containing protein [Leptospiraceae bacterium]|nr:DUF423 domain-containing protein [Leptospiraceae bacterium]